MPGTPFGQTPGCTFHSVGLVPRLVGCDRDELPRHQPALARIEVHSAALNGLDPEGMLLEDFEEVFEFRGLPVEPVHMPDDHLVHPGPDLLDQGFISGAVTTVKGG